MYQNLDGIKSLAQYRTAIRQIATDMANGTLPLKKATSIVNAIKEIRGSLALDINIHAGAGIQIYPKGEIASWSIPQEETPKAAKPKADPKPLSKDQVVARELMESASTAKKLADLKERRKASADRFDTQIRDLEGK